MSMNDIDSTCSKFQEIVEDRKAAYSEFCNKLEAEIDVAIEKNCEQLCYIAKGKILMALQLGELTIEDYLFFDRMIYQKLLTNSMPF